MLKARKANRVVKIPDEKKKTYIALGYTITDMDGNVLHEHVEPSEKLEEASEYAEKADKKIEDLEKKNAETEKEIEDLKAQLTSAGAEQATTPDPEPAPASKKSTKASSKAEK